MKEQWSNGVWMAIGIITGVVFGGILGRIFDKLSIVVVIGYPLGLVLGFVLRNRFGKSKKFGAHLTPEQRRTQLVMIVILSILVVIGMLLVSYLTK